MNLSKYIALSILIIVFVFDLSFAEEKQDIQSKDIQTTQYGFKNIPFGASYKEVKQKLEEAYKKPYHRYVLNENSISLNHFDVGKEIKDGMDIQATFYFDHNKKFYSFSFQTERKLVNKTFSIYKGDKYLLMDIFKNTYGEPSKCADEGADSLCEWSHKDLDISIRISHNVTTAYVTSKKLQDEYNSYQENKSDTVVVTEKNQEPKEQIIKDKQYGFYGFQDIPFGASYEEVYEGLKKIHANQRGSLDISYYVHKYGDLIKFDNFNLGNKYVIVMFYFDHNKKFYGFDFKTDGKTADYLNSAYTDGEYLTDIFKNKYGVPSQCYTPSKLKILTIEAGRILFLCKWQHKDLEIYTGFTTESFKTYATASVTSKKLQNEYNSYKKQQENKSIKDGAKKF